MLPEYDVLTTQIPASLFGRRAVPVASVPMKLPWMTVPPPWTTIPATELDPPIVFPAPGAEPPIVLFWS